MKNQVLEKLKKDQKVLGTFMELADANVVECMGLAGLDFFVFDTEHGPCDALQAVDAVRAAAVRPARLVDSSPVSSEPAAGGIGLSASRRMMRAAYRSSNSERRLRAMNLRPIIILEVLTRNSRDFRSR